MTLNIAHRGFSSKYPENTMKAFIKAVEEGNCDGIELDIQLTKDNVPIIIHDESLERTTNGFGLVKDYTFNEIRKLNAGLKEKIPSLEEFLNFAKDNSIYINLELKNSIINYKNLESIVLNEIYKFGLKEKTIISSFNHLSMVNLKSLDNTIKTGLLYDCWLYNPVNYSLDCRANALHPHYSSILDENYLKNILDNNIEVNTYTVNDEIIMDYLINSNVSSIITNHPDMLNKLLKSKDK